VKHLGLVVEGPGDQQAVPVLVRDHLSAVGEYKVGIGNTLSANGRDKLLADEKLERFVKLATLVPGACGVLVVFDAEDDAACAVGPEVRARAASVTHLPVRVCVAIRSFENWIAASADSVFENVSDEMLLQDTEGKGALGLIKQHLPVKYVKTVYQARLTARIDHSIAGGRCPSLARLFRCVDELVAECG
jgi:hypothetical protein